MTTAGTDLTDGSFLEPNSTELQEDNSTRGETHHNISITTVSSKDPDLNLGMGSSDGRLIESAPTSHQDHAMIASIDNKGSPRHTVISQ